MKEKNRMGRFPKVANAHRFSYFKLTKIIEQFIYLIGCRYQYFLLS